MRIPASVYRQAQNDYDKQFEAARWRGTDVGAIQRAAPILEASVEKLVKQFHKEALKK
jgi:hypothetical protein